MKNFLSLLLLLLFLVGCSSPNADSYQTGETEEDVVALFNEREYAKAIWLIESQHGQLPSDPKISFLLAQGYLGKAGIEPLSFAAKVLEAQKENQDFFPHCSNAKLKSPKESDLRCLLKRVYYLAPNADSKDFKRARLLFRHAYPNPATSPMWVNTIIGMVETISFVNRAGNLYLYGKRIQAAGENVHFNEIDIPWLKNEGIEAVNEADNAIQRAQYSSEKVSKLLGGTQEIQWFEQGKNGIEFAKSMGLSGLLSFVQENLSASDDIRYGELIEKLKALVEENQ